MDWIFIQNYEGEYQVSESGLIRRIERSGIDMKGRHRLRKEKVLNPTIGKQGYQYVTLSVKSDCKKYLVHRIVCQTFHKNPFGLPCVNHKDGNKLNNAKDNLEWCTYSYNMHHAMDNGLYPTPKLVQSIATGDIYKSMRSAMQITGVGRKRLKKEFIIHQ